MTSSGDEPSLLIESRNCWRQTTAARAAFLVDGEAFFGAVADTLENARHSVWLLGWDFHSAVELRRDGAGDRPGELVALLDALARERAELHVRVLAWDFAMLYALEREFLPVLQFGARTHRRVHFAMDAAHPFAASQHQKLVVVDDAVAFAGGFDLTAHRWDTRAHRPDDPRRVTPSGQPYAPFHDVQIAVDGGAAAALAELARERWRRATGRRVAAVTATLDPWPTSLAPHVRDVSVGIARTQPQHGDQPEVREVAALYRDSIAAARRWIYVENQYLTSHEVGGWLADRLAEADGPEVVIVGPRENAGWLEENTMGALRSRVVARLREADRHDRLRVLYPHVPGLPDDQMLNVHAKVMIVDDEIARVGSSNLSNRSLGLDTECDVVLVARGEREVCRSIASFRDDLLAEHLGTTADAVARQIAQSGSLVRAVDALRDRDGRTLRPLRLEASEWTAEAVEALGAVDPEHPVPLEELVSQFESDAAPGPTAARRPGLRAALVLAVLAAFALLWRVTPLAAWVSAERIGEVLTVFRATWYGPAAATALFTLACVLLVPVTALTVAAGLALGPVLGIPVAWLGSVLAALLGHVAGRLLWRDAVRRLAGRRLNELSRRLGRRGVLSSALLRIVPVAPFMVVNLVAGASHVRAVDFVVGTAVGMLPGTVLLIVAADSIRAAWSAPSAPAWLWAALALLALLGAAAGARRLLARSSDAEGETGA